MQTFLPYKTFWQSALVLDRLRLGKQRVEAKQILMALSGETKAWANHPAVRMWKGYEKCLCFYGIVMCSEWQRRGYKDTLRGYFVDKFYAGDIKATPFEYPKWLTEEFCASHRSALLAKDPQWYWQFGWKEEPKIDYIWPGEQDNG